MNRYIVIAFTMGVLSSFIGGTFGMIAASPYTQQRTERMFVYANLNDPFIRAYACLCWTEYRPMRLDGFTQTLRNIVASPRGFVRGGIIYLSHTELNRLDEFQVVPGEYTRQRMIIDKQPTWVYVKNR